MRILHLANHCGKANGHVNVSVDVACAQAKNGHEVGYASSGGDFIALMQSYGVRTYEVREPHRGFKALWGGFWELGRAIRDFRPDVIHLHMAAQSVIVQPFRLMGYKTVSTVHNEFDRSVPLMGFVSRIINVSAAGAAAMVKRGFSKKKVRVVLNGTLGSPRLPQEFTVAALPHPAVISVCGLHPRKGVTDLIHAFKIVHEEFPAVPLYILGEGPHEQEYWALARELGLDGTVHFLGFRDDPREYLYGADVFVLASHADPGPLVIAEARNAGLAVIATDVDGIPQMLDHGEAGVLVPPKDPLRLAEEIKAMLRDPERLSRYKQLAKTGCERFSVQRVCRDLDEIYREII